MLALTPAAFANTSEAPATLITSPMDNITVKGVVVDETGAPIPGVSVYVKGTTQGTISDIDGNFSLTVPSDATLVFSYVGCVTQEIAVNGKANLGTIKMMEDNRELEQVVVIGYGTQKKVDLTGSVAIVDADEMKKVSNSNISTMLEGKVAGVQITSDGQPGADPTVRIRGIGSFNGTAPLYVVDGVPMGSIRDFSPNDIASIQILKDASAAAIYGSRAANGVIIITTKQGKKNQPMKIDYTGYFGVDKVIKAYDVMNAQQFTDYMVKAHANSKDNLPAGYDASNPNYLLNTGINTDWFDESFKTGIRQNHNVNLSGGSENSTYNVGLDYYNQEGTIVGAGPSYQRYTARVNNTMDVKFLKLKTSVVYSHSTQDGLGISNANEYIQGMYGASTNVLISVLNMAPTIPAYDENTWCLDNVIDKASNYDYDAWGFGTYDERIHGDIEYTNPLLINSLIKRNTQVDRVVATAGANLDLFGMINRKFENHKLSYNLNLSYSKTFVKGSTWTGAFILSNRKYLDKQNERLIQYYNNYSDGLFENTLNYEGTLFEKNHISAVIGQTFEKELYHNLQGIGIAYPTPYFLQIQNAEDKDASSAETEHVLASYIGRLNYDYDQKYLLSATVRRDGSSRLSSNDRWGWFPSISLGWRLDREDFFPVDDHLVNLLKVRGSYGILGNENIGEYQYAVAMARQNMKYSFGGNPVAGSAISNFANTAIMWEKKKSTSIGLDLGMYSGQLEFSFEYFKNVSDDLLYSVAVPTTTGVANGSVVMNAASMDNSGFEWTAAYHNYKNKLKYDISLNLSTLKNKVTSLGNKTQQLDGTQATFVGQEIGQHYGWTYAGIIKSEEQLKELNAYAQSLGHNEYQDGAQVGDCYYVDINNDGFINGDDQSIIGSGLPSFNFGLSGRLEYNNFDLSVSTFGALGFKVEDIIYNGLTSCYGGYNHDPIVMSEGYPNVYFQNKNSLAWNDLFSERKLQNGNYWKIANIELGYNFKDDWFKGVVSGVRVYVSAQNLATITGYKGYNIDFAGGAFTPGRNYCSYPTPRTFMFGLTASF